MRRLRSHLLQLGISEMIGRNHVVAPAAMTVTCSALADQGLGVLLSSHAVCVFVVGTVVQGHSARNENQHQRHTQKHVQHAGCFP
jgi:hypothetical protein